MALTYSPFVACFGQEPEIQHLVYMSQGQLVSTDLRICKGQTTI